MIDFVPLDRSQRIAGAGASAASRATAAEQEHARIERFRRRGEDDGGRGDGRDRFEHAQQRDDEPGTYEAGRRPQSAPHGVVPTAATPAAGDSARGPGYSQTTGQTPHRQTDTPGQDGRIDFVA